MRKRCAFLAFLLSTVALRAQPPADSISAKVDAVVRAQMAEQNIPGVTLAVMRDGKIIKAAGYGFANLELKAPMTPELLLKSGSLGKQFTAASIMMLVEEGKVGLDDEISKYLPESPALWKGVTIRRLLTHTSGIRDFYGEDGDPQADMRRDYSEDDWIRSFAAPSSLRFAPGDKWSYCNAGYILLGAVIHRVTGKTWFEFQKQRIFDPLGMTSTQLIHTDVITPRRASGYVLVDGKLQNEPWMSPSWASTAAGSLYLNVYDLEKWNAALDTERLLRRASLQQMWTPVKLNDGSDYPYGFAFRLRQVNGHHLIQHDGVETAFTNRSVRYVDDHLAIVVMMNIGEDDDALRPTRMTDDVAAIYIPGLKPR